MKSIIKVLSLIILIALLIGIFSYLSKKDDGGKSIIDNIIGGVTPTTTATPATTLNPYTGAVITKNSDSLRWTFINNASMTKLMYGFTTTLKPNTNYRIVYSISPYYKVYDEEYEELPGGYFEEEIFEVLFSNAEVAYRLDENSGAIIYNENENYLNDIIDFTTGSTGYFSFFMATLDNNGGLHPVFTGTEQQIQYHKDLALILKNSDLALSIIELE